MQRTTLRLVPFLLTVLTVPFNAIAAGAPWEDDSRTPIRVPKLQGPVHADGIIEEDLWNGALAIELPFETDPGDNLPAPVRTEVLLAYDERHLYVAFRCFDPEPERIRAHYLDRDRGSEDEWVAIVLDTFNDERRSLDFMVNPLGVQTDFIEMPEGADLGWDAIWDSGGTIHDLGWSVEMVIPVTSLRFQRTDGPQVWGFDAFRSYTRDVRHELSTFPQDRNNNCYLCQALKIELFDGVEPGRNLEIAPTLTYNRQQERDPFPGGAMATREEKGDLGVTTRWSMTPNLTLGATWNPDFSDIEADALQIDVNRPFALFFPERRPFFTEGSDIFRTRLRALYTRMMREPEWGLKLSGKEGRHTIGAIVLRDEVTNLILPAPRGSAGTQVKDPSGADVSSTDAVLRYKQDFGNRYTLGVLGTSRDAGEYSNRVWGLDGDIRITKKDRLRFQWLRSRTEDTGDVRAITGAPAGAASGDALELAYGRDTKHASVWAEYRDFGDAFRPDLGFMPRIGIRDGEAGINYHWIGAGKTWWSGLDLGGVVEAIHDQQGEPMAEAAMAWFGFQGPLESDYLCRLMRARDTFAPPAGSGGAGKVLHLTQIGQRVVFQPTGDIRLGLHSTYGDEVLYTAATYPSVDPSAVFDGRILELTPTLTATVGLHLKLNLKHTYERLRAGDDLGYRARITELRAVHQFNLRSFVRAILQYTDVEDFSGYENELLETQLLYSYKINPRTVLFAGYTDGHEGYRDGPQIVDLEQRNRRFFVKLGYAWVL